ncbi:MAG: hypothetical protein PVF26_18030 [Desulfobacterales bacterium]|jgi:hypothetical protein
MRIAGGIPNASLEPISKMRLSVQRFFFKFLILAAMLLGLPLGGVYWAGYPVSRYLEFPPKTTYVSHAPFSWIVFALYALLIFACLAPLIIKAYQSRKVVEPQTQRTRSFPWWGWLGLGCGASAWVMAWTRFDWFASFQPHTFTPLWLAFILVVNGLSYRHNGKCMMLNRPVYFLLLFPTSAAFWWFFEYLNRFVQNWFYAGPEFSAGEYFWYATLPFSTVLPAVLGIRDWILSTPWLRKSFRNFRPFRIPYPKVLAALTMAASASGLAGIGVWPNTLFPLLWVSPLLIILSLQILMDECHILSELPEGNWTALVAAALAAVICGVFWEMWNYYSLAKWNYSIPFVHRLQVFEMPILGYAGYLPFGLECAVIGSMLEKVLSPGSFANSIKT